MALVTLDELLEQSDFVSFHCRLTPETRLFFGAAELARMKPTAYLINVARGELIDQAALTRALAARRIAGAGRDVFAHEPLPVDDPLVELDNVILTPHWMPATAEIWTATGRATAGGMLRAARGELPDNIVNPEVLDRPGFRAKLERFTQKLALVTGSGTGIGQEVALEFARQGAHVALHYAHSAQGAEEAVRQILAQNGIARAFKADLQHVAAATGLVDGAVDFLGGLDLVVNNAGITYNKPFDDMTPDEYDRLFNVNVRAQYFITQRALPHMLQRGGGAVVNMTSVHGLQGMPEHSGYAATKGAIIALTRQLGIELAHRGIRINAIAPGWIEVPNHYQAVEGYDPNDANDKVPRGRVGKPLDIAKLAVFLCSDDADFIVGQTIVSDGGTTSLMSLVDDFRARSTAKFGAGYVA